MSIYGHKESLDVHANRRKLGGHVENCT